MENNEGKNQNIDNTNEGESKSEDDKKIDTIIDIAKFYYINKKYKEALEHFEQCLALVPENEDILLSIALIHEVNNDIEKAKDIYQKILKKNPDNKHAREKLNKLSGL